MDHFSRTFRDNHVYSPLLNGFYFENLVCSQLALRGQRLLTHNYVSRYVAGLLTDYFGVRFATFVERQLSYNVKILFCAANGTELSSRSAYDMSWVALESIVYVTEEN